MNVMEIPFAALRLQYRIARFPLQVVDDRLISKLDPESPARLLYQRSLGSLDAGIGGALGDTELEQRGTALRERSDALARAATLDAVAEGELEEADAKLAAVRDQAAEDVSEAHDDRKRRTTQARQTATQRKSAAAQRVQKQTAEAKRRVDEVAARRKNSAEAAGAAELAEIRADEQSAKADAEDKLDDATAARQSAADKRVKAEKLDDLADTEAENRRRENA
ncbi:hypothetical protein A5699_10675 [Mycobacterium sp. E802]|uniref:hypothetical protein n=1 Tax=Mycobacterium sp. E802 TaxID=1834152 RepID=UPI0008002708|nr:hypothetical protein [Mycobacterium sp. E802]OBG80494.1 hypothetical protein A5699_10675 [Mycobacterium sp. E802]